VGLHPEHDSFIVQKAQYSDQEAQWMTNLASVCGRGWHPHTNRSAWKVVRLVTLSCVWGQPNASVPPTAQKHAVDWIIMCRFAVVACITSRTEFVHPYMVFHRGVHKFRKNVGGILKNSRC